MLKNTERFGQRTENYVKYRPQYPVGLIDLLQQHIALQTDSIVADIGSGTGISSIPFLKNGNTVYGIEPNDAMRLAAEKQLQLYPNFKSIAATAEHTTLADASADIVLCAQAFHWFDAVQCKLEFDRIRKKNGKIILMWNERLLNSEFLRDYEKALLTYADEYRLVDHRNVNDVVIHEFYSPQKCRCISLPNAQYFDFEGLKGRLLSSSYCPTQGKKFDELMKEIKNIYHLHNIKGKVCFAYETKIYFNE